eukprot:1052120-Prorocentrum_lima.AAC.1
MAGEDLRGAGQCHLPLQAEPPPLDPRPVLRHSQVVKEVFHHFCLSKATEDLLVGCLPCLAPDFIACQPCGGGAEQQCHLP